jgi:hypothetical protein
VSDIQRESQAVLDSIKENYFHGAFGAWKKRCDRLIRSKGDYIEGDGSQKFSKLNQHLFFDLVRELSDKPRMQGRGFDCRCHWIFQLT